MLNCPDKEVPKLDIQYLIESCRMGKNVVLEQAIMGIIFRDEN